MDAMVPGNALAENLGVAGFEKPVQSVYADKELLDLHKEWKRESFEHRWVWERNWMRNIHYTNNRMWITYVPLQNVWRDVKLAKWVPKPVTPLIWEGVQTLRSMFASVEIGATVRPNGTDPKNVAVASLCDDLHPILHKEHLMDEVMAEFDYWFIVCGWACVHTYYDRDVKYGTIDVAQEQCLGCDRVVGEDKIAEAGQVCPTCGGTEFVPAVDELTGEPSIKRIAKGRGRTDALSPFELVFNNSHARFGDVPYVYRLRWRSKSYYENHPTLGPQVAKVRWSKAPSEQSLQLFRSLPFHTDMGTVQPFLNSGSSQEEDGAVEYECWVRPCDKYPEGLVFRILGDNDAIVLHLEEDEAIPGPLPYVDADGNALFPFEAAPFELRGGRVYGSSPLDAGIPIMNQINQIDSMCQMYLNRMGNPVWFVPKRAGIQKFTGEPGLVIEWDPIATNGAEPKRVDGSNLPPAVFQLREQKMKDLEEALGTYDALKGDRPPNVNSFSQNQLLVERAQARFVAAHKGRGRVYGGWLKAALEIEREFGDEVRRESILSPAGNWVEQEFKNTDLQGSFSVVVDDGSMTPKTSLGQRAAVEHLTGLGAVNVQDPDTNWAILQMFGQAKLSPRLNIHMQSALRRQQLFEQWAMDPVAQQESRQQFVVALQEYDMEVMASPPPPSPDGLSSDPGMEGAAMPPTLPPPPSTTKFTPLAWKDWYDPDIHLLEFDKWMNTGKMFELVQQNPMLEPILTLARQEILMAQSMKIAQTAENMAMLSPGGPGGASGATAGRAQAMSNSNSESGGSQNATDHRGRPQGVAS